MTPTGPSDGLRPSAWSRWWPVALYAAFIFALSSVAMPPVLGPLDISDKIKHFALYGVFAFLVARALAHLPPPRLIGFTVLLVSVYGASDEIHQWFVPGRSAEVGDWVADTLAAVAAAFLYVFLSRRAQNRCP